MSNIGVTYNNPGNLTANGIIYPGQTGVYSSPNGLSYATFGTPQAGSSALVSWLQNNLGTDTSNSLSTIGETLSYYLNGSYGPLSNTANNPNAVSYGNQVAANLGMDLNQPFTQAQLSDPSFLGQLGGAISQAEGTSSVYTFGSNTMSLGDAANLIDQANTAFNNSSTGQAQATTGGLQSTAKTSTGGLFGPLIDWFNGLIGGVESGIEGALVRGGFITVGLILLAAGIFFVVVNNGSQVKAAAKNALTV